MTDVVESIDFETKTVQLLEKIYNQLKIVNAQLSEAFDLDIDEDDIND